MDKKNKTSHHNSESGQAMMEYIVITLLIGIICMTGFKKFGSTLKNRLDVIESQTSKNLKLK